MLISFKVFRKSLLYAWRGFRFTFQNEQNFRIQVAIAIFVIVAMVSFRVQIWEAIILLMVITSVLVLEILNTIFEKMTDLLKPRLHHVVEIIKDMMAMAVLLASVGAVAVGIMIFLPHLLS